MYYSRKEKKIWLPFSLGLCIALGILIGVLFSQLNPERRSFRIGRGETGKLEAVLGYINESYVDKIDMRRFIEDALPRMMQSLDPHSAYFTADEMQDINAEMDGHFSGVGVNFYLLQDTLVITSILSGGPSEAAGLRAWDRVITVNDTLIAGKNLTNEDVHRVLRGMRGSEVKLGIRRNNANTLTNITVTRSEIPLNTIHAAYMVTDRTGLIKLGRNFGHNTFNEFITALARLKNRGANSFIIDLRGNAGGSLETVVAMVNEFLERGELIVYTEGRNFPRTDSYATGSGTSKNADIVVLVDEISASASEIFAGAIQDHDRGLVIGRRTFGKGLVQSQREFPDGSAVRLTVARYYTASGRSIQREFEKGNHLEYEMDAISRFLQGDETEENRPTENLIPFSTLGGRTVYGGDGIMPDIFVPRDTEGINSYYNSVVNNRLDERYAMMYSDTNRERLSQFDTRQELLRHLRQQPLLLNLVSYADNNGIRRRPVYIQESSDLLERSMHAHIVRNFFGEEAFWAVYLQNDPLIGKGVELIESGKTARQAIVGGQYR
jgi:carboxyl-terminal processing protease